MRYRGCFGGRGFDQHQQSGKLRGGEGVEEEGVERGYVETYLSIYLPIQVICTF